MQKLNSLFGGSAELWRKYEGMQNKVTSTVIIRILRMIQFNIKYFYREFMMFNNHFSNCFNTSLPPLSGPYESATPAFAGGKSGTSFMHKGGFFGSSAKY